MAPAALVSCRAIAAVRNGAGSLPSGARAAVPVTLPVHPYSTCSLPTVVSGRRNRTARRIKSARAAATEPLTEDDATRMWPDALPHGTRIGVLGGGQLGRMLAIAAASLDVSVAVLDPTDPAPAKVAARQMVGNFRDMDAVREFAKGVDVLTVEIEHVDVEVLRILEKEGSVDVVPAAEAVAIIQDKYAQKVHFQKAGVPLAESRALSDDSSVFTAAADFGYPLMLKARRLAYDGRGNSVAKTPEDLPMAIEALGGLRDGNALYAEKWAPFVRELAVMVVRSRTGEVKAFPVVETVHRNNICHTVTAPASIPRTVRARASEVAQMAIRTFPGAGIFGVELFELADGTILLNEVAPRPHNSGHYTIEACATSQYEQHLRALLGWPLGDASLIVGAAIMQNILGDGTGPEALASAHRLMGAALATPGAAVHWYGKDPAPSRKCGHITVVADDLATARERIAAINAAADAGAKAMASGSGAVAALAATAESRAKRHSVLPKVGIIMGSDSDLPVMADAAAVLEDFGVECEVTVVSAHRTPDRMLEYARGAADRGIRVIIAGAGGAAHLPGMVASLTPLPVIGVPVPLRRLDGVDSLYSILQMPKGVPVATVAIGNAANAGLLAVRILAASNKELLEKMQAYQDKIKDEVLVKADKLEGQGWREYLSKMPR